MAHRLVGAQFPQWADLPIFPVKSAGTDNALFRLGQDMVVRLPRMHWAATQAQKEQRWLPQLAPLLPLAIPVPLAGGEGEGYPWNWSISTWLKGANASLDQIDQHHGALALARFITALRRVDPTGGPVAGEHNFHRGVPLVQRDAPTRQALAKLEGMIDVKAATDAWEDALRAAPWNRPGVWIHGDLHAGNLLARGGKLSAVIDFGGLGVGDPACDLMVAWNFLDARSRAVFRGALDVDDATWSRGRGWALSMGLIALPYYHQTNTVLAGIARRAIDEILAARSRSDG